MTPRLSIVMAAYQAERTIGAAVGSVLSQTVVRDVELVIVDDGSTDGTAEIAAAHSGPIRIVRQDHGGVARARNRGLGEARADLVTFCDADDVLFPHHVEALLARTQAERRITTANAWLLYPGGLMAGRTRFRGRYPAPEQQRLAILEQNVVSIMSLFPRTLADEIGPFREDLETAEDWDFWIRAVLAGWRIELQPEPLALIRWGSTGLSAKRDQMDDDVVEVLRGVARRDDLTDHERAYVERRLSGPGPRELGRAADQALRAGRYFEAAQNYRRAAALSPSERFLVWKSRAIGLAPPLIGPVIRARQLRRERRLGLTEQHHH